MIPFAKGHGLGNDYIVIDAGDLHSPLSAAQIERICDRNWGVGSDGILLLVPAWAGSDFGLRIMNPAVHSRIAASPPTQWACWELVIQHCARHRYGHCDECPQGG